MHYARHRRGTDLTLPKYANRGGTPIERLMRYVEITSTCWLWTGVLSDEGYGKNQPHRRAYRLLVGPIPRGLQLDHTCFVRHCVNPDHLEPVANAENQRRAAARRMTCRRGHDRSLSRISGGEIVCRVCERESQRRYRERRH